MQREDSDNEEAMSEETGAIALMPTRIGCSTEDIRRHAQGQTGRHLTFYATQQRVRHVTQHAGAAYEITLEEYLGAVAPGVDDSPRRIWTFYDLDTRTGGFIRGGKGKGARNTSYGAHIRSGQGTRVRQAPACTNLREAVAQLLADADHEAVRAIHENLHTPTLQEFVEMGHDGFHAERDVWLFPPRSARHRRTYDAQRRLAGTDVAM